MIAVPCTFPTQVCVALTVLFTRDPVILLILLGDVSGLLIVNVAT